MRNIRLVMIAVAAFSMMQRPVTTRAEETANRDAEELLFVCRFIEVAPENVAKWKEAVVEKQSLFNSSPGSSQWGTWRIATGPRTGHFARGFVAKSDRLTSPLHPTQGLAWPTNDPEAEHWMAHIQPLQKSSGNTQIWRPIPGLASNGIPQNEQPRFWQHRRWRMKPGMYQRLESNYKKFVSVFDHLGKPINFSIARLADGGDHMIYAESTGYNDSRDLPSIDEVKNAALDLYGEGAWEELLVAHGEVMQDNAVVETESWVFEPELSSLSTIGITEQAVQKTQEHIDRVRSFFSDKNIRGLSDEFLTDGIRSLSTMPAPAQGRSSIEEAIQKNFQADQASNAMKLEGTILNARFLNSQDILTYGTFVITNPDGQTVRRGKWGDVLQVSDGKASFLLQSGYAEDLESVSENKSLPEISPKTSGNNSTIKMIQRSIDRFTSAYNRADAKAIANEFTVDGVRLVSGLEGVYIGREQIEESFHSNWSGTVSIESGTKLSAQTLYTKPFGGKFIAAAGVWRLHDSKGKLIDGGNWGNVFQKIGSEVKLLLESAGSVASQPEAR